MARKKSIGEKVKGERAAVAKGKTPGASLEGNGEVLTAEEREALDTREDDLPEGEDDGHGTSPYGAEEPRAAIPPVEDPLAFTDVKYNGKKVVLRYTAKAAADSLATELSSSDTPRPEFAVALRKLAPMVITLLGLDTAGWDKSLVVTGLHLKREGLEGFGAVVNATNPVAGSNAPFNIATPFMRERGEQPADVSGFLPAEMSKQIRTVLREASLFVDKHRAQVEMFAGNGAP